MAGQIHRNANFEARRTQRLREELGINEEGIEVVVRLLTQLEELKERLRLLEAELDRHARRRSARAARYEVYLEASWREVDEED